LLQLSQSGFPSMNPRSPFLFAVFTALLVARVAAVEPNLAFLGPKGSYSDEAANEYASHAHVTGTIPLKTITEIAERRPRRPRAIRFAAV
jgi:hypothetical protein